MLIGSQQIANTATTSTNIKIRRRFLSVRRRDDTSSLPKCFQIKVKAFRCGKSVLI